jgi:hypothetical protein
MLFLGTTEISDPHFSCSKNFKPAINLSSYLEGLKMWTTIFVPFVLQKLIKIKQEN